MKHPSLLALGLALLSACLFDPNDAQGLPCIIEDDCGPKIYCIDGICGGQLVLPTLGGGGDDADTGNPTSLTPTTGDTSDDPTSDDSTSGASSATTATTDPTTNATTDPTTNATTDPTTNATTDPTAGAAPCGWNSGGKYYACASDGGASGVEDPEGLDPLVCPNGLVEGAACDDDGPINSIGCCDDDILFFCNEGSIYRQDCG